MTDLITSGLFGSMDLEAIADIGWTLVIIYGVSFILSLGQGLIMAHITQRISKQLRTALSDKVNKLPMAYYNNTTTGDILSRVTNDIDTIGQTLNQSIGMLVTAMCLFIGSLIMMFKTNVIMSLTSYFIDFTRVRFNDVAHENISKILHKSTRIVRFT